jgi:hypothetical protein
MPTVRNQQCLQGRERAFEVKVKWVAAVSISSLLNFIGCGPAACSGSVACRGTLKAPYTPIIVNEHEPRVLLSCSGQMQQLPQVCMIPTPKCDVHLPAASKICTLFCQQAVLPAGRRFCRTLSHC